MASEQEVKKYVAYWLQLGKKIVSANGDTISPLTVIEGDRYSCEFEILWKKLSSPESEDCYIEGTIQSIQELLSSQWDLIPCARCTMPVPMINMGFSSADCPCHDLSNWPNTELPLPREPVDSRQLLNNIREKLLKRHNPDQN